MSIARSSSPEDGRPILLDEAVAADREQLSDLQACGRVNRTIDLLPRQLAELAMMRTTGDPLPDVATGCWVFFPWSGQLVRTLPSDLWATLRTDRNRYKLTSAEQQRLRSAAVAVAGLSVGASVVQVMALEGIGGLLRLADPDVLDGSNLNRLRAALWDLGRSKAVLAARMAWEIDPFRPVEVVRGPVGPSNVGDFLDGVDVVVEECDSFEAKVLVRREARDRGIPVVMATSEAGMLDVERFDLEPSRPLFHGLAPDLESGDLCHLSAADRVALAAQVIGAAQISDRSAASMIELDRSVSSWPQLAGEVVAGGAHAAVAVRRIVLGQPCPSGRYHLDIDEVLRSGPVPGARCPGPVPRRGLGARPSRAPLDGGVTFIDEVVAAAITAPSAGNSQPWQFGWDGRHLAVRLDRRRAESAIDPQAAAGWVAVGAACENVAIVSSRRGRPADFSWFPDTTDPDLAALISFPATTCRSTPGDARLFRVLERRRTDRSIGAASPLSEAATQPLHAASAMHGASVHVVEDRTAIEQFATLLGRSDRVRLLDPTLHRELVSELRWTDDDARATGDGIDVASLGLDRGAVEVLRLLARPEVSDFLARHDLGGRLAELQREAIMASSALALISVECPAPIDRVRGGRALQRVWLEATSHGIGVQPVTPLSLFGASEASGAWLAEHQRRELESSTREVAAMFDLGTATPIAVLRLHRGACGAAVRSLRRPVLDVFHTSEEKK